MFMFSIAVVYYSPSSMPHLTTSPTVANTQKKENASKKKARKKPKPKPKSPLKSIPPLIRPRRG
jgi:hypothetical protein